MKLIVSNIDWDHPDRGEGKFCPSKLPTEITIDDEDLLNYLLIDIDGEAANLAEYLTDTYGYCVCGFTYSIKGVNEP